MIRKLQRWGSRIYLLGSLALIGTCALYLWNYEQPPTTIMRCSDVQLLCDAANARNEVLPALNRASEKSSKVMMRRLARNVNRMSDKLSDTEKSYLDKEQKELEKSLHFAETALAHGKAAGADLKRCTTEAKASRCRE